MRRGQLSALSAFLVLSPACGEGTGVDMDDLVGTWQASIDVLTITETGDPFSVQFEFTLSGATLTLTGGDVDFDFNGTGDLPAELDRVLVKQ